ncbi:[FeFe] hydrogenase H-cluster maturation GTPase HydF [Desulfitobacterium metallireducens]|uniref:GTP-binding protein n=1 Tax=Desulfitobacterium metallireducens DSM 15288 TaxID=871968 RepID=W0E5F8_9FIRM|nr:[FeFe] hydrogenase H-cluster maturation GTPase HydF [Desulfitobacterium metallireducens]AHF05992.1 GTP-binding protein [Desulfitobacterium metallireducens DSM 15288]
MSQSLSSESNAEPITQRALLATQIPTANQPHIALFGKRNAGKSSLLNAIIGQDISLVSSIRGTTTDPVSKTMELIPLGPVVFIDTAGLDDEGELGVLRVQRTHKVLEKTDFALYIFDIHDLDPVPYRAMVDQFMKFKIPFLPVINKIDDVPEERLKEASKPYPEALFVSASQGIGVFELKNELVERIQDNHEESPIVGDLIPQNGTVVLVVPVDSEAPKGRIILPQVQIIRDCLDHGIKSCVVRDIELESALQDLKQVDLVITDSQAFKRVNERVPSEIKITSFSILFARHKGDLKELVRGVHSIQNFPDSARILIAESCTHNHSHEDIGRYKIPKLIDQVTGKNFSYDFKMGHDFPTNLEDYALVIHCGSCMLNKKTMETRIRFCQERNIPITNYGVVLAHFNGILDRTLEIFSP